MHGLIDRDLSGIWQPIVGRHFWEEEKAFGFYNAAMGDLDIPISVRWGSADGHYHIQITGQACAYIRGLGALEKLAEIVGARASRIDLCIDLETDLQVQDFIDNGHNPAFKTSGFIHSATGDTAYVGSRKSQRMCRVYRYHAPHPRSPFLRLEAEYKGAAAKRILHFFQEDTSITEQDLVDIALEPFDFKHPILKGQMPLNFVLPPVSGKLRDGGSLQWLVKQVLPAMLNMHKSGVCDMHWFLETYVLPALPPKSSTDL